MEIQAFKGSYLLSKREYARATPDKRRRASILRFLSELPADQLEKLVSIKEYDPDNVTEEQLQEYTDEEHGYLSEAYIRLAIKQVLIIEIPQSNE